MNNGKILSAQEVENTSVAPTVSVIIPAYNAAMYIDEALQSVFAQTFSDYEVIVINDGSPDTDELERVIEPYRARIVYIKQENRGPSGARNAAILLAKGEYVALLDSDDTWLPDYLAEQIKALHETPSLDLIYSDAFLVGDSSLAGQSFMQSVPMSSAVTFEKLLRWECSIITTCVVARKQALIDAGLFDENFYRAEDYDLWLRLAHSGRQISYQWKVLARHRLHQASLAADRKRMVQDQSRVLQKLAAMLPLSQEMQDLMATQIAKCEAYLHLYDSKQHLCARNYKQAAEALESANKISPSFKLQVMLLGLRFVPSLLHRVYMLRHQNSAREIVSMTSEVKPNA